MKKTLLIIIILIVVCGVITIFIWYFLSSKNKTATQSDQNVLEPEKQTSPTKFSKKVFFIHHSTGEIYWNGGMEKSLLDAGYEAAAPWWDANTDPADFYTNFKDLNQWQILEPYSIIIFKSCFPASDISSDEMLEEYKTHYNKLYEIYRSHPDKLFVPLSTPPLLKNHTTFDAAQRALAFESWLTNEYLEKYSGHNLAPFKLHSLLSDNEGYLKAEFISSNDDDHPNAHSGKIVGPAIVNYLEPYTN